MKNKIEVGKTYKGKQSGTLVIADALDKTEGWFLGHFKSNEDPKAIGKMACLICAFELVEPEFKYPTLFEVVLKYQSLGINIDFDNRGGRNMCFISNSQREQQLHRRFSYGSNETENSLVKGILFNAGAFNRQALEEYNDIERYENRSRLSANVK